MMRALTYLPVIDFIIFFISSSRDFHASPSLLKIGPLLFAAPLAFRAPSKLRHPRHVVPVRGELAHPGGDLGALEGVSDPGQGGPEGLAGTEPVALPGAGAGGTVLRRARQRVWGSGFSRALWCPGAPVSPAILQLPRELAHLDHECAPLARQHGPRQHAGWYLAPSREGRRRHPASGCKPHTPDQGHVASDVFRGARSAPPLSPRPTSASSSPTRLSGTAPARARRVLYLVRYAAPPSRRRACSPRQTRRASRCRRRPSFAVP